MQRKRLAKKGLWHFSIMVSCESRFLAFPLRWSGRRLRRIDQESIENALRNSVGNVPVRMPVVSFGVIRVLNSKGIGSMKLKNCFGGVVLTCTLAATTFTVVGEVTAGVILDWSPQTTGAVAEDDYTNLLASQSFAELFSFANGAQVTGMDIYDAASYGHVGDSATISLWSDSAGQPGALITRFTESVSVVDTQGANTGEQRLHVDFTTPLNLSGGTTYWIGMTGTSTYFLQTGLKGPGHPGDSSMYQYSAFYTYGSLTPIGDMAFRLEGNASPVPEPSSFALLGLGALSLAVGAYRRRRMQMA